ncbi:MAG: hypothetical protein ACON4T_04115 [Synechococcus sp.]
MLRRPLAVKRSLCTNQGFLLPLSIGTSLVLLLSSASLQTLVLHGRLQARSRWQATERSDQLRSAAMAFLDHANTPQHACLLAWPLHLWPSQTAACNSTDVETLTQGANGDLRWTLLDWQPSPTGAQLHLRLGAQDHTAALSLARTPGGFELQDSLQAVQP